MPTFDPTSASHAVLIEVMNVLGAFREDIVLVRGWVPGPLYPGRGHMGSLDVDLAVSRKSLDANVYRTILHRMLKADYSHHTSPTHFTKTVAGVEKPVKVDLVAGPYEGAGKTRRRTSWRSGAGSRWTSPSKAWPCSTRRKPAAHSGCCTTSSTRS